MWQQNDEMLFKTIQTQIDWVETEHHKRKNKPGAISL